MLVVGLDFKGKANNHDSNRGCMRVMLLDENPESRRE